MEMRHIRKEFPGVVALKDVTFGIRRGTIHALVGENGAGKSTLMKIINGMYRPTSGSILINGEEKILKDPIDSEHAGIGMVFQELQYVPQLTIEENLFVGRMPTRNGALHSFVDWKTVRTAAKEMLEREGLDFDPKTTISELSVADIQMLEIVKVTSRENLQVIILDEPTSSLSNRESERLFRKIRELKERGVTVIYISHKLDEVFALSDYITVLRDGEVIETRPADGFNQQSIVAMMVGRELSESYPKEEVELGEVCFEVRGLTRGRRFRDISFYARRGEILGLAGLVGAGRTEVSRAIAGLDPFESGTILVDGKEVKIRSVLDAVRAGIMTVTEDRRGSGFVGIRSIRENIALPNLEKLSRLGFLKKKKELQDVDAIAKKLRVKAASLNTQMYTLSGGNQQKVVLAKWLLREPKVLIVDEPTRGIDVGAKHEIYKLMSGMAKSGITIIMISSELPELIGMVDRAYVMNSGRIVAELDRAEISQESIMHYAAGGQTNE